MICTTIREGEDCVFMKAAGCTYNEGHCSPIIEKCTGCQRAKEFPIGTHCNAVPNPALKWINGNCNLATHIKIESVSSKQKLNPIKASKRK